MHSPDSDINRDRAGHHPVNELTKGSIEEDDMHMPPTLNKDHYEEGRKESPLYKIPEEIMLSIIGHLDVRSMLNFMQTCKYLLYYLDRKSVWLDALETILLRRPVPLSYRNLASRGTTAELPLDDVRRAVRRATRLEYVFKQDTIAPSRVICRDGYFGPGNDRLHWVWNLDIDRYTMAYSTDRWFSCTINATGQVIAFQVERQCSCWDFDLDLEGITVIFNSLQHDMDQQRFYIYRIVLGDGTSQLVSETPAPGWVRSNFIEDDIAGCVLTQGAGSQLMLHIVNWRSGKRAFIDTGIESPQTFSASSTKKYILMSSETMDQLHAWTYEFRYLQAIIDQAESPDQPFLARVSPQYYHLTQFAPQGIQLRWSGRIVPTTRGMWCGRKCVFSVFHQENETKECITYSLVSDGTGTQPMELPLENGQESEQEAWGSTRRSKSLSRRTFIYTLPEGRCLSLGGGWYSLCAFGHSGKHAVWVEESDDLNSSDHKCLLATFDHEDDGAEGPISSRVTHLKINEEGFDWNTVLKIELDDNAGILSCMTASKIWSIYL
ncbi:hypothetical protein FRC15_002233 [Serendipita sp. 397]|nr:hypothetical protein FRC15_002233 [Serendipita sp. 397]